MSCRQQVSTTDRNYLDKMKVKILNTESNSHQSKIQVKKNVWTNSKNAKFKVCLKEYCIDTGVATSLSLNCFGLRP